MKFDDDEEIVDARENVSDAPFKSKRTKAKVINKTEAPLEQTQFKVMLQITGIDSGENRLGLDLVTVLDISGSMEHDGKLEKLKIAMQFLIKKLSPIDRLSVVTFSNRSNKLCPLRQTTENSQVEIEKLIKNLDAGGGTNIRAGLEMALQVLNGRRFIRKRSVAIMLMSDGDQNHGDATEVDAGNVPVYTFGFGTDYKPDVLNTVANNSAGGTFSVVQDLNKLSEAFSQCLAGLLSVVVQDLKVTFTQQNSITIEKVSAGNYPQSNVAGSVTVSFGDLYEKEVRKVILYLLLPAVKIPEDGTDILEITHSYSPEGEAKPIIPTINRVLNSNQPEREELMAEEIRNETAKSIKAAREKADKKQLDDAKKELQAAQELINRVFDKPNVVIELLKTELQELLKLMATQDIYDKQGRAFALSAETSHALQRFASRGDVRAFATELMNVYLEQAKSYDKDPSQPLPPDPIKLPPTPSPPSTPPTSPRPPPPPEDVTVLKKLLESVTSSAFAVLMFLVEVSKIFGRVFRR